MTASQSIPSDSTQRFTGRAEYFRHSRPGYPDAVVDLLRREAGLRQDAVVADVGAGTGLSSELFLRRLFTVYAVEPNAEMRQAAAPLAEAYTQFQLCSGSAEETGLPTDFVDLIFAGTAFHWFDTVRAKEEFRRILKPGGFVALCWNRRRAASNAFGSAYEDVMLRLGTDYKQRWKKDREDPEHRVRELFGLLPYRTASFANYQLLDEDALLQRALSSSWAPLPGEQGFDEFEAAVRRLFEQFQVQGQVTMEYDTILRFGQLER